MKSRKQDTDLTRRSQEPYRPNNSKESCVRSQWRDLTGGELVEEESRGEEEGVIRNSIVGQIRKMTSMFFRSQFRKKIWSLEKSGI